MRYFHPERANRLKVVPGRAGKAVTAWVFGLALTILLISLWGRAVVADAPTLGESLSPLSASSTVMGRVESWLVSEIEDEGVDRRLAVETIDRMLASSVVDDTVRGLITEVVAAAADPSTSGSTVDVAGLLQPVVPELVFNLDAAGVEIGASEVESVIARLDPLVVREPDVAPVIGPQSPTARRLGTASVLSAVVLAVAGAVLVRLGEDPWVEVRQLGLRIALSALSFGVLLRVGGWLADPRGGRAPVSATISALASSKSMVPLVIGLVATAVTGVAWLVARFNRGTADVRPGGGSPTPVEAAIRPLAPVRLR